MEHIEVHSQEILEKAFEKLDIIKKNSENFSAFKQLCLASSIRDYIVNNSMVNSDCEKDESLTAKRKELLRMISEYQKDIISSIRKKPRKTHSKIQVKDYTKSKSQLIELLSSELEELSSISKESPEEANLRGGLFKHIRTCQDIIDKCKKDKYTILLMGEYQTGKTTTLNAFCGGRNIGSIGDGTKTSAVPLTITYSEDETVNVKWKEIEDFTELFSHIKLYVEDFELSKIENPSFRKKALQMLNSYRSRKDEVAINDWQYLSLWSLVLNFWGSNFISRKESTLPINTVSQITRFPKKLVERWEKKGVDAFSDIEAAFIFVKQIDCFCASEILRKMNCTVIDCPGLFANVYDTMITEQEMNRADAILYILPREKQTGEQIDYSLQNLQKQYEDLHRKLIIVNNLSFNNPNSQAIFAANSSMISSLFKDKVTLYPYDANLAYLGCLKESYESGLLDSTTIKDFIDNTHPMFFMVGTFSGFSNFDDAWSERISVYRGGVNMSSSEAINRSNFLGLIANVKNFVDNNKAYSIIYANGVDKVSAELNEEIDDLYFQNVEPYTKDTAELSALWNRRIDRAKDFAKYVNETLHSIFFERSQNAESLAYRLATDVYNRLFTETVYDTLVDRISDRFYSEAKEIKKLKKNETELKKYTVKLVSDCLTDIIRDKFGYWNTLMRTNQDSSFNNIFATELNAIRSSIELSWSNKYRDDPKFIPTLPDYLVLSTDFSSFCMNNSKREGNANVDQNTLSTVVALDYTAIATAVTGMVGGYVALLFLGPIGIIVDVVLLIASLFASGKIAEYNEKKFKKKVNPELKGQLEKSGIKSSIKVLVVQQITRLLETYSTNSTLDVAKIERKRDIALHSQQDPSQEMTCFHSVNLIKQIESQIDKYDSFIETMS